MNKPTTRAGRRRLGIDGLGLLLAVEPAFDAPDGLVFKHSPYKLLVERLGVRDSVGFELHLDRGNPEARCLTHRRPHIPAVPHSRQECPSRRYTSQAR